MDWVVVVGGEEGISNAYKPRLFRSAKFYTEDGKQGLRAKYYKMAMKKDLGFFFGLGSVAYAVSLSLSSLTGGRGIQLSSLLKCRPHMIFRLIQAKCRCKKENRQLLPKDLFHLKGFMVAGTDNQCYKDDLEELWGIRPMELFAGTEPSIMGTETWVLV